MPVEAERTRIAHIEPNALGSVSASCDLDHGGAQIDALNRISEPHQLFGMLTRAAAELQDLAFVDAVPLQQRPYVPRLRRIVFVAVEQVVVGRVGVEYFSHLSIEPTASATRSICASVSASPLGM